MGYLNIKIVMLFTITLTLFAQAKTEISKSGLTKAGEEMMKKFKKESSDKTTSNWVGLLQCQTSAGDYPVEILSIEFRKDTRSACANETFERLMAVNSSSKDYTCGLLDETFCLDEKEFDTFNGHFLKKKQNLPYIHFVDKKKRNQIMMITPRFFKEIGLADSLDICRSKAKNLSSTVNVKAECIEPTK